MTGHHGSHDSGNKAAASGVVALRGGCREAKGKSPEMLSSGAASYFLAASGQRAFTKANGANSQGSHCKCAERSGDGGVRGACDDSRWLLVLAYKRRSGNFGCRPSVVVARTGRDRRHP